MSSKKETERNKQIQEKCQLLLTKMLRDDDNKYCVDCDAKGPRWASWNLGIFLCIRCAGIHRNLGVHISRVKSVNLDTWTPEQVVSLEQMGNSRARAVYEALLPDGFRRPQTDSALESFIRAKYEHKKYIAREWKAPPPPKVDWDKEIDEEIEKQKKKKKSTGSSSITIPTIDNKKVQPVVVALPKPKASTATISIASTPAVVAENNGTLDLLGLSLISEDDSGALKKPVKVEMNLFETISAVKKTNITTEKASDDLHSLAKEEADFFNPTPSSAEAAAKLTKDKIMALYGNSASPAFGNFTSFQSNTFVAAPLANPYPVNNNQQFAAFPLYPAQPFQSANSTVPQQNVMFSSTAQPPQPAGMPYQQAFPMNQQMNFIPTNASQPAAKPTDQISNQFGNLNLRDVWQ